MHLITLGDFVARFAEGQSVVYVGNAPSLTGTALGQWIDSHDIVVRFNETTAPGFEKDVGQRTDVLVSNPYPSGRRPLSLTDDGIVVLICPQTRRLPSDELPAWLGSTPVLFTFTPDLVQVGDVEHTAGLTTGVYGVHLLSRLLRPNSVSITGFTMFLQDTAHHYWCSKTPKGLRAHDVVTEASVFISVINNLRCALTVTEDISWVARRVSRNLRPGVNVLPLNDPKWRE